MLGLRLAQDGRLLVPVLDAAGKAQSLQFIAGDGSKRFFSGCKTAGGFFPLPARDGSKDGPLLIAEGYATAASLFVARAMPALWPSMPETLKPWRSWPASNTQDREIILCADNDCETHKPDGTAWNPGEEAAQKAAASVGARFALCPSIDGGRPTSTTCTRAVALRQSGKQSSSHARSFRDMDGRDRLFLPPGSRRMGAPFSLRERRASHDEVHAYRGGLYCGHLSGYWLAKAKVNGVVNTVDPKKESAWGHASAP